MYRSQREVERRDGLQDIPGTYSNFVLLRIVLRFPSESEHFEIFYQTPVLTGECARRLDSVGSANLCQARQTCRLCWKFSAHAKHDRSRPMKILEAKQLIVDL